MIILIVSFLFVQVNAALTMLLNLIAHLHLHTGFIVSLELPSPVSLFALAYEHGLLSYADTTND
jgi:hypothetical protein